MSDRTDALLAMLERGQDSALLRFSLGTEYFNADDPDAAIEHLQRAVELDEDHSAAWKLLGKAYADAGRPGEAIATFEKGIETAERNGDRQAVKEMQVFMRRAQKALAGG